MNYSQSITRNHRTAFVLLIDGSGSMAETIRFRGRETTKAEAVAAVTNDLLFELLERARRHDGVRDYYDIALVRYSGDDEVTTLWPDGRELLSVAELAALEPRIRMETTEYRLPDGGVALRELPTPVWVEPHAAGQTPIYQALDKACELLARWTQRPENADSFPPVVFNITDGEATDCEEEELRNMARRLRSLRTSDGNVLLINIHIASGDPSRGLFLPTDEEADYPNRYARLLYDCSSAMPEAFTPVIRAAKGPGAMPPFRGMSYNASAAELVAILNIGSVSVKTE